MAACHWWQDVPAAGLPACAMLAHPTDRTMTITCDVKLHCGPCSNPRTGRSVVFAGPAGRPLRKMTLPRPDRRPRSQPGQRGRDSAWRSHPKRPGERQDPVDRQTADLAEKVLPGEAKEMTEAECHGHSIGMGDWAEVRNFLPVKSAADCTTVCRCGHCDSSGHDAATHSDACHCEQMPALVFRHPLFDRANDLHRGQVSSVTGVS